MLVVACLWPAHIRAENVSSPKQQPLIPDLGTIRYQDPEVKRSPWLGLDTGGVYLPRRLGLFERTVWVAHVTPAWSLALLPNLAIGGRHTLLWYDAGNIRLSVQHNELELATQIARGLLGPNRDRLAIGMEFHTLNDTRVRRADGSGYDDFAIGGIRDKVLRVGFGMVHSVHPRWTVGWRAQGRYVWVLKNTQRQARFSVRLALSPAPGHEVAAEGVLFLIHRDERQFGHPMPTFSVAGQASLAYQWMSAHNVGIIIKPRLCTAFLSGEAPMYEIREESLRHLFVEGVVGLRVVWD